MYNSDDTAQTGVVRYRQGARTYQGRLTINSLQLTVLQLSHTRSSLTLLSTLTKGHLPLHLQQCCLILPDPPPPPKQSFYNCCYAHILLTSFRDYGDLLRQATSQMKFCFRLNN